MGNRTDPNKRSARERLLYIEQLGYWRGWVRRQDLIARFGISTPQASADLAAYNDINPGALSYNKSEKRYEGTSDMATVLSEGRFSEAMAVLGETKDQRVETVVSIDLPLRSEPAVVVRHLVAATMAHRAIEIHYYSVNSGSIAWRWISPHAFAHDGYRWHVRAWCHKDKAYKDFVFGRIAGSRGSRPAGTVPKDTDWLTHVTVRFRARATLSAVQKQAVERDFAMKNGVGRVRVRRAMLFYTLAYLGLVEPTHPYSRLLESVSDDYKNAHSLAT
jgi:hypothetical protein